MVSFIQSFETEGKCDDNGEAGYTLKDGDGNNTSSAT